MFKMGSNGSGVMSVVRRVEYFIGRRIYDGLFVLIPLLISILVLRFVLVSADSIFRPFFKNTILDFAGVGLIVIFVVLYVIGSFFSGRRSRALQDAIWTKVPVIRGIYAVVRQARDAFYSSGEHQFRRVVYVEWPRPGVVAMGFVTGRFENPPLGQRPLVAVYIPTVPNPTSGMLAFFPEDEIIETKTPVRDAMKTVFSGGIVLPDMPVNPGLQIRSGDSGYINLSP